MCRLLILATLLSIGWSQGPEDCIEHVINSIDLAVKFIPPGVVCFQCDFGSGVDMNSTFTLDGSRVDSSDGDISMGLLVIFNTTNVFGAVRRFLTCASGGNTITNTFFLASNEPPLIAGNATVMEGDTLILECDATNTRPLPTVAWISPQRITLSNSRDLEIFGISRTQNGTYTCVATAADGKTINTTVTVAVIVNTAGPQDCIETVTLSNDRHLQTQYVLPGIVCFQCDTGSGVGTDSTFLLDQVPVDRIVGNIVQGVLVIFESDEVLGNTNHDFSCSVDGATVSSFVLLRVFQPPLITGNATVIEGDTLSLKCDATNSQPLPTVAWISPQGITLSNSRDLEIASISRTKAGAYTCVATDFDQQTVSSVASVIVQYAPVVSTTSSGTQYFPLGMTFQLSCHYSALPAPHLVTWGHNGDTLMDSNSDITVVFSDVTTTLTRTNLPANGGGRYVCSATNVAGSDSASVNVTVQLPPGPPTNLTITASTSDSLSLSWSNPSFNGFSPISSFKIAYTNLRTMATESTTLSGGPATVSHMLFDLSPLTTYSVAVHVSNAVGLEGEATNINGQTRSLRPGAVTGLTLQPLSSTQIWVQWNASVIDSTTTSPITSYTIRYQEKGGGGGGGGGGSDGERQVVPPSTSVVLGADGGPPLMKGTDYIVTVVVSNQEGPGLGTSASVETDVDPPTVPLNFAVTALDPFTLQLQWAEPSDTGGRPISTYRIAHRVTNTTAFSDTDVAGDSQSYQIRNLMQDTDYEVVITAINLGGLESPNVTVEGRTAEVGPPQVPAAPAVSLVTNQSALASWTDPGGYPFQYLFQFKRLDAEWSDVITTHTLNSAMTSYQLTILQPLTAYSVRVASRNINGLSNYSAESTFGTYGDVGISAPTSSEESPLPAGKDILLTCSLLLSQYSPTNITYTWSRVNGALPENSVVDAISGTLILQSPSAEDSGAYECTSSGVSALIRITVESASSNTDSLSVWIIVGAVVATVLIVVAMSVFFVLCCCCWRKYYRTHPDRKSKDTITTLSLKARHK